MYGRHKKAFKALGAFLILKGYVVFDVEQVIDNRSQFKLKVFFIFFTQAANLMRI